MTFTPFTKTLTPVVVATSPNAGTALVNGTPTLLSWTAPNDGQVHMLIFSLWLRVTSNETGGAITFSMTTPDGIATGALTAIAAGQVAAGYPATNELIVAPGSTVTIAQTALTGGAATFWGQLWAV